MIKNKILLVILSILSIGALTLYLINMKNNKSSISSQDIAQNIEFISGYIKFTKYGADEHIRSQEKIMNLPNSEFLRIRSSIQEVSVSSITVATQYVDDLNFISHVFHFQTKSSLIIANYSQESNRLIFRYAAIFRNDENRQIYDPRLIVLSMNDSFREVVQSLQGENIQ